MKDLFIIWIIFQLVLIGVSGVSMHNEIQNETYDCEIRETISPWIGAVLPLVFFMGDSLDKEVNNYCENKVNQPNQ